MVAISKFPQRRPGAGEVHIVWITAGLSCDGGASYRMAVHIWRSMMDEYYPNTAWLCLRRDVFDRLYAYKVQHGISTFEETLETFIQ